MRFTPSLQTLESRENPADPVPMRMPPPQPDPSPPPQVAGEDMAYLEYLVTSGIDNMRGDKDFDTRIGAMETYINLLSSYRNNQPVYNYIHDYLYYTQMNEQLRGGNADAELLYRINLIFQQFP
jgi:hypothetical protein